MIERTAHNGLTEQVRPAFEFVPVAPAITAPELPPEVASRILVDVIHDGDYIPEEFLVDAKGQPIAFEGFANEYWLERDWGACLVAQAMSRHLGLAGYHRVNVARVLMDFGRFPGITHQDAPHLDRYAINYPFSSWLSFGQKRRVLETLYDEISVQIDKVVRGTITKVAVHTYDQHNRSGTERPDISICTQPDSYNADSALPFGVFDELYPDILAECTSDRLLRDRVSLTFEKAGFRVAHNYPYTLPDGSIEVRSQVWAFFRYLWRKFEQSHPHTAQMTGFRLVWNMLFDTNLRSSDSETLRSYLYMFRRAPPGRQKEFSAAQEAYEQISAFVRQRRSELVRGYQRSPERLSSIGIEVRKDLVWRFNDSGDVPLEPIPEAADEIGQILANAMVTYLVHDRELVTLPTS